MQTKKGSVIEVFCNVGTGLVTDFFTWKLIFVPHVEMFGWDMANLLWWQIFYANGWFTLVSIMRGYFWRRYFNQKEV